MAETKKRPRTPAQIASEQKYNEHARFISLKLNDRTDADILEKLSSIDNMQGYIKRAIRAYMDTEK